MNMVEPPLIKALLERSGGNRAAAAQALGLHRSTLRQKLLMHHIDVAP
jgi:two-component system nitrogen regulation response regulator GlnG